MSHNKLSSVRTFSPTTTTAQVAAEAPTTPPAQHPPHTQRPAARVLSFSGAGIESPDAQSCDGSPGELGTLRPAAPGLYTRPDPARPMSGLQACRSCCEATVIAPLAIYVL